jgi:hypothetical protein
VNAAQIFALGMVAGWIIGAASGLVLLWNFAAHQNDRYAE